MNGLLVRTDRGNLSITFDLSAFIADWEEARKTFVAWIAERFRELLNPRPGDFTATSPAELGEAWCKYRIFGGSSTIVLRADSLALSFPNIVNADYQIVVEVVRGVMENLLPALEGYERHSYMVGSTTMCTSSGAVGRHTSPTTEAATSGRRQGTNRRSSTALLSGSPSDRRMDTGCCDAPSSSPKPCQTDYSSRITPSSQCRSSRGSRRNSTGSSERAN